MNSEVPSRSLYFSAASEFSSQQRFFSMIGNGFAFEVTLYRMDCIREMKNNGSQETWQAVRYWAPPQLSPLNIFPMVK